MPLPYLIVLFIGIPLLELALLLKLHSLVGLGPTILLVLFTGVAGASLVKRQGIALLQKIQQELAIGNLPAPQMMDGVMILVAGALLITPGILTDITGFLLLVPIVRSRLRHWLRKILEAKIRRGDVEVHFRS